MKYLPKNIGDWNTEKRQALSQGFYLQKKKNKKQLYLLILPNINCNLNANRPLTLARFQNSLYLQEKKLAYKIDSLYLSSLNIYQNQIAEATIIYKNLDYLALQLTLIEKK